MCITTTEKRMSKIINAVMPFIPYIVMGLMIAACILSCGAFANGKQQGVFDIIFKIAKYICGVLGVIFIMVGIMRYVIAHNNESGPDMQKAAQMLATGLVLIALGVVVSTSFFQSILPDELAP